MSRIFGVRDHHFVLDPDIPAIEFLRQIGHTVSIYTALPNPQLFVWMRGKEIRLLDINYHFINRQRCKRSGFYQKPSFNFQWFRYSEKHTHFSEQCAVLGTETARSFVPDDPQMRVSIPGISGQLVEFLGFRD